MKRKGMYWGIVFLVSAAISVGMAGCGLSQRGAARPGEALKDYAVKGKVIQHLKAFDNPESAVFSADGKFVFISNAGELGMRDKGFAFVEHGGSISKLEVQPDGTLKMINPKLIEGMTGPLGMAVSTKATKIFPAGTIFLCTGNLPMAEANGAFVSDPARLRSEIVAFDVDGNLLGALDWGSHSMLSQISGAPATQPNGIAFDKDGNLYIAETGMGGITLNPPLMTGPGVMMIPHGALDELAVGRMPAEQPMFIPMAGAPDGVAVCPTDQTIHANTVGDAAGLTDTDKGAMFKLTRRNFVSGSCPPPFASGFGALDGLAFLPNGTRLDTQVLYPPYGVVVTLPGRKPMQMAFEPPVKFNGCGSIAVRQLADGSYLLVVPQTSWFAPNVTQDEVTVVELPKDFGTMPAAPPKVEKKPAPTKAAPAPVKAAPKAEPKKPEPKKAEPVKVEPKKAEPVKVEPKKTAPVKAEPKKAEPRKTEPAPKKESKGFSLWPFKKKEAEPKKEKPAAAPVKTETKKAEPTKIEPKKAEPPKAEPPKKAEPVKVEPIKAEPVKAEPKKAEPKKAEPAPKKESKGFSLWPFKKKEAKPKKEKPAAAPVKTEPKKAEPAKTEPKKAEPVKVEPKKAEPVKAEPKKAEPKKPEPAPKKESKGWSFWPFKKKEAEPKKEKPVAEPVKPEAKKTEPAKAESKKAEPRKESKEWSLWPFDKKEEPKKPAPAEAAPAKEEATPSEPGKEDSQKDEQRKKSVLRTTDPVPGLRKEPVRPKQSQDLPVAAPSKVVPKTEETKEKK